MTTLSKQSANCFFEKRVSQWEELMKKFSQAHKEVCKSVSMEMPRSPRSVKFFPTGSQYGGTWDVLGMSGNGVFIFPNGVIYEGDFEDGYFHGPGKLRYDDEITLRGKWNKGVLYEKKLIFKDGLEYCEENWKYCKMPDRRFSIEYDKGLNPAGESYLTADQPTREIPPGMYDTCDGFYDPKTRAVYKADDLTAILRSPSVDEQTWIVKNCRTNPCDVQGPSKYLYEEWSKPELSKPEPPGPPAGTRPHVTTFRNVRVYEEDEYDTVVQSTSLFYDSTRQHMSLMSFLDLSSMNFPIGKKRKSNTRIPVDQMKSITTLVDAD